MILDNLDRALKTQNWLAAALEFVIVLAGVVAGFQISAWADARAERQREALLLARLEADFTDLRDRTVQSLSQCEAGQGGATEMADLLGDVENQDRQIVLEALSRTIGTPVPFGRSATYVELLASGEMALIRSEELRGALVDFDQSVERQSRAYESLSVTVIDNAGILLETWSLAAAPNAAQMEADILERLQSAELTAAVQIMRRINARSCYWFEEVNAAAGTVLDVLEQER